ncbi:MAG: ComEC/Rec2 family competence protein [Gemmatimonadota bacterium]
MRGAVAALRGAATGLGLPAARGRPAGGAGSLPARRAGPLPALAFLSLALCGAAALRRSGRRGANRHGLTGACLLSSLLSGTVLGAHGARQARASCTADLRSGDAVVVAGRLRTALRRAEQGEGRRGEGRAAARWRAAGVGRSVARGGPPRSFRLTLLEPSLRRDSLECRIPSLVAYVVPPAPSLAAGALVRLRGEWRRFGGPIGPGSLRPGAGAVVRARLVAPPRPDPSRGTPPAVRQRRRILEGVRARAAERLARRLPPDVSPVALALTVADRDGVDPGLRRRFADAGLAHLLSISGLHVGILVGGVLWLAGFVLRRRARYLLSAAACLGYVLAIGAPIPALRACILFGGYAVTRARGSPARVADLLGAAALVTLVADPLSVLSPGFQLSFAGFSGLAAGGTVGRRLLAARLARRSTRGLPLRLRAPTGRTLTALSAGAGAFAFTAPVTAAHFHHAAPIAILSNFAGVPLIGLSLAALTGTLLLPGPPGALAADAGTATLRLLMRAVDLFAAIPWGHGDVAAPLLAEWTALAFLLLGLYRVLSGGRPRSALLPLAAACAVGLAAPRLPALLPGARSLLCTLDVGQGDAAALRTRRGRWIVFDAGPPGRGRGSGIASFLASRGVRTVELLVLSHPHLDHIGGTDALLERFEVRRVLDSGNPVPDVAYDRFLAGVEVEGATWLRARSGSRVTIDDVEVTVLSPPPASGRRHSADAADANEASVVVRVEVSGAFVYLNSGDASATEEREMLERWPAGTLRADLLKLGHHGSRTSSDVEWLRATRPEIAVISVGRGNRYGHPHAVTLARIDSAGVPRMWRTDRDGTLCLEVSRDGNWRVLGG